MSPAPGVVISVLWRLAEEGTIVAAQEADHQSTLSRLEASMHHSGCHLTLQGIGLSPPHGQGAGKISMAAIVAIKGLTNSQSLNTRQKEPLCRMLSKVAIHVDV